MIQGMTWIVCPHCGAQTLVHMDIDNDMLDFTEGNDTGHLTTDPAAMVHKCTSGNGGCEREYIVNIELEAHITTRKIETEEGGT